MDVTDSIGMIGSQVYDRLGSRNLEGIVVLSGTLGEILFLHRHLYTGTLGDRDSIWCCGSSTVGLPRYLIRKVLYRFHS